jgi:hypothetical protein
VLYQSLISAKMTHDLEAFSYHVCNCIPARVRRGAPRLGSRWYAFGRPVKPSAYRGLPPEVRANVERSTRACGAPVAALHLFSRYIQDRLTGDRFIALHFEDVQCANQAAICTKAGCLHQVYVSRDGSYRVILNVYAPEIELKLLDGAAVVEIARGQTAEAGVRDFRWDGSHLHPLK